MKNINNYILEKFKINKDIKNSSSIYCENEKILIDFLQLTDDELINAISDYFEKYNIIDISVQVNEKYLYNFKENISIPWNGELNQEIFKGESFLCKTTDGNFDIMKWIINGSHDYSKLNDILLYSSKKDKISIYGSTKGYGIYLEHSNYTYEILILKKTDEKNK